jgi:hypothetical protein
LIQQQQLAVRWRGRADPIIEDYPETCAGPLRGLMGARMVDQNPPHELRRHAEEVCPILPLDALLADEPEIRLVHQASRRQRVVRAFVPEIPNGPPAEFSVHQRHEVIARLEVPATPRPQQTGHDARVIRHATFPQGLLWVQP